MATSQFSIGKAFSERRSLRAFGVNVHSTGGSLWSYGWWEMARWVRDRRSGELVILARAPRNYFQSTACQFSRTALWRYGAIVNPVETPLREAYMTLPEWAEALP
jgi:hypothetical protein